MESDDALLLKIGRNLLLYQKAEYLMKSLSLGGELVTTFGEDSIAAFSRRAGIVAHETLGQVTRTLQQRYRTDDEHREFIESLPDACIAFTCQLALSEEEIATRRQALDELLKARNRFIHRLYPRLTGHTGESCESLLQSLDSDHDRFAPLIDEMEGELARILEARRSMAELLGTEEVRAELLRGPLRTSQLVSKLTELHPKFAGSDGWASLGQAVRGIQAPDPSWITGELARFECRSLRELLLATGDFEIREQPTEAGRIRVLYRPLAQLS